MLPTVSRVRPGHGDRKIPVCEGDPIISPSHLPRILDLGEIQIYSQAHIMGEIEVRSRGDRAPAGDYFSFPINDEPFVPTFIRLRELQKQEMGPGQLCENSGLLRA